MQKSDFTDEFIRNLSASPSGLPQVFADSEAEGLKVVVMRDQKIFVFAASFCDARVRVTMRVGVFPHVNTDDARREAKNFQSILGSAIGHHPPKAPYVSSIAPRVILAELLSDYVETLPMRLHNKRSAADQAFIRSYLLEPAISRLLQRPACDLTTAQAGRLIEVIARRRGTSVATSSLVKLRAMYNWAMRAERRERYGVASNPFKHLAPRNRLSTEGRSNGTH